MEGPTDLHAILAVEKELTSGCIIVMARGARQTYMRMQRRAEECRAEQNGLPPAERRPGRRSAYLRASTAAGCRKQHAPAAPPRPSLAAQPQGGGRRRRLSEGPAGGEESKRRASERHGPASSMCRDVQLELFKKVHFFRKLI